jgi:non-ribosomal peptide synthetase component F
VCSEDLAQLLPAPSDALAHVVLPEEGLGPVVSSSPEHSPGLLGRIDDLVYVIYTSGSTGEGASCGEGDLCWCVGDCQ